MTVHSKLVKLKVEQTFQRQCKPKTKRVDFIWYPWEKDKGEQYLQLVTSNRHPVLRNAGTNNHIEEELSHLPVCQDGVRQRKNSPKGPLHPITTLTGHPGLKGDRDYLRSKMQNISYKWITADKLREINARLKQLGFKKGLEVEDVKHHPTRPISLYKVQIGDIETG
jgi:hypothetical protein